MKFIALSKLKTANSQVYFILNDQCPHCDLDEELRKIVPEICKASFISYMYITSHNEYAE